MNLKGYLPECKVAAVYSGVGEAVFDRSVRMVTKMEELECSKCKALFKTSIGLRQHKVAMHDVWPLVNKQSNQQSSPVEYTLMFVCTLCCRQYKLMEDLCGHYTEFHNFVFTNQSGRATVEAHTSGKNATKESTCIPLGQNATAKGKDSFAEVGALGDTPIWEMRSLPFKDFRGLLREKMYLKCPISQTCTYKFADATKLSMHVESHKTEIQGKFRCSECSLELENWRRCSSHLWKVHQLDVDLLNCPVCEFKSHSSVLVWRHMRLHKKWRPRVLKSLRTCRERLFRRMKQFEEKVSKPPPNKNKYYSEKICELCNRKFVNGKTLSKHVKMVHNKIKPFICNICGKQMARKATLIVHMRQHTGEKPLHCKVCKYSTRDPSVLKSHQMRHEHTSKHKCLICDYVCIQANSYKRHMQLNHPEEYKKISCNLCGFVTISEQRLHVHKGDHRNGLIAHVDDSLDASGSFKNPLKSHNAHIPNICVDYLLPLESIDSLPHEPTVDTGGVTIPAPSEDTQFPTFLNN